MYIVLTSRPGQYRSEPTEGITPVETHDYFYGVSHVAAFVVARLEGEARVRIVEDAVAGGKQAVNLVPTKFFEKFATLREALASIEDLTGRGHDEARLVRREN
ncbi:hypothetical protein [Paraburkholderia heleia]|uniref:hypothetical protein n=1 Tax=Paraburkholderia heleia TaxID=634127 RepID=UPI0005A83E77|nr:hypothetical protein [Paraburkholderia heleia]